MNENQVAQRLCEQWMKSPDRRQRIIAVDEMAAFMAGVKAALEIARETDPAAQKHPSNRTGLT